MTNMKNRNGILIYCTILSVLFLVLTFRHSYHCQHGAIITRTDSKSFHTPVAQRNNLSVLLNEMRKKVGQMDCEIKQTKTNAQGGWCKKESQMEGGHYHPDWLLMPFMSDFLAGKTVASYGEGPGIFKRELTRRGKVARYDGYDGSPYIEESSGGLVKFLDLSIPHYGLPVYDWIVSIEVFEHIPAEYGSIVLDNVFRHAREGVLLSWATPGQEGLGHVNNRPHAYVINVMQQNGFEVDMKASEMLKTKAKSKNIQRNLFVYHRVTPMQPDFIEAQE